ncbi:MAG: hypothetical protein ABR860_05265 [Terracidiphilus sp.]|jgi:hypothetical protein
MVRRAPEPTESNPPEFAPLWALRDWLAAAALFAATAAVVLWQNAHIAVLFDLSYILNTAERIALGQVPYRDFPLAHAPLTFLIQAAIIRLTGRVFFHHVLYVAITGGLGTVLAWRIALTSLRGRVTAAWTLALVLAAPLIFLGIYCIVPNPEYDCDCGFWLLVAIWSLLQLDSIFPAITTSAQNEHCHPEQSKAEYHLEQSEVDCKPEQSKAGCHPERVPACRDESKDLRLLFGRLRRPRPFARGFAAGAALVIPLFFKQNMGLPFLVTALAALLLLLALNGLRRGKVSSGEPEARLLLSVLAGAAVAFSLAALVLLCTAGLGNYLHWTIQYAGQRRLPELSLMLDIYRDPTLAWTLPCVVVALLLLWVAHPSRNRVPHHRGPHGQVLVRGVDARRAFVFAARVGSQSRWARIAAIALLAAPFLFTLASLLLYGDADERGDSLLSLWPLLLVLAAALALVNLFALRRRPSLRIFLPVLLLAAIHGTFLSQQLWGSTYGIWPLLILLLADLLAFLGAFTARAHVHRWFTPTLAAIISITLLVCGGFYTASEERLSYAHLPDGPPAHSAFPALAGLATPGPYLPEIDELLRYAQANIPFDDGIVLIPGEEPFYFATGRSPRFPVPFFDPTIDPYSPAEIVSLVQTHNIRWLIVKSDVQTKEDPTPDRAELLQLLTQEFTPAAHLRGYEVYRR